MHNKSNTVVSLIDSSLETNFVITVATRKQGLHFARYHVNIIINYYFSKAFII